MPDASFSASASASAVPVQLQVSAKVVANRIEDGAPAMRRDEHITSCS
jgi:hypothetical protein